MVVMGEVTKCLLPLAAQRPAALIVGKGIQDGGGGGVKARGSVGGTQLPREMVTRRGIDGFKNTRDRAWSASGKNEQW